MDDLAHGSVDPALALYMRLVDVDGLEAARRSLGLRSSLFGGALTIWLMIRQRLLGGASQEAAWGKVCLQEARALSPTSARALREELSASSSGLDYGRRALPLSVAVAAGESLAAEARKALGMDAVRPTFLLDGTTLSPEHSAELAQAFPPASNQRGKSHWPVALVVVAHDLETGLAALPEWGAKYGPDNTSEQALAIRMAERLPENCRIVADRAFGIFAVAWAFRSRQVLVRMTAPRAQALAGKKANLAQDLDMPVAWRPSKASRETFQDIPEDAELCGRLIVQHGFGPDGKPTAVHLFTNDLESPADELVLAYAQRWTVETDLRSLKHTVGLEVLRCRTVQMLEKELVLAVVAYNLIRTVMALAARKAGLEPRRMSFARAKAVMDGSQRVLAADDPLEELLRFIAGKPLPNRKARPSPPRRVWKRRSNFPARKAHQ